MFEQCVTTQTGTPIQHISSHPPPTPQQQASERGYSCKCIIITGYASIPHNPEISDYQGKNVGTVLTRDQTHNPLDEKSNALS
jgi:hypothetical protein